MTWALVWPRLPPASGCRGNPQALYGHARISPNLAGRLEEAGVSTARAWLAMQSAHDVAQELATGRPEGGRLDSVSA